MKNGFFILLAMGPGLLHGQDTVAVEPNPVVPITYATKNAWHISALLPNVIYEHRIGPQSTLVVEYGLGFIFADPVKRPAVTYVPDFRMNSKLVLSLRRYYAFEHRVERGRSIRYNSSGYLMAKLGYHFAPFDQGGNVDYKPNVGPYLQGGWGIQRTYRKNLYLNLAAGPQLWFIGVSLGIDAAIGYTLPTNR